MLKWLAIALFFLTSCTTEVRGDPSDGYVERVPSTILEAPGVNNAAVSEESSVDVAQGKYLVELLGCGACHTNGALIGDPDYNAALAGSEIGIAFTTPLQNQHPGVVYPPNITSDVETGIGGRSVDQIVDSLRRGAGRHGSNLAPIMPWPGYSNLSDADAYAIAMYLKHTEPVVHQVPKNVPRGERARGRYVYFGIYEKR